MNKSAVSLLANSRQFLLPSKFHHNRLISPDNGSLYGKFGSLSSVLYIQERGLKEYAVPQHYKNIGIELPERQKLLYVEKVPQFPHGIKPPKMRKNLIWMRGPEEVHNKFIHKQYGLVATGPGRLRYEHFEMIRLLVGKQMDTKRMFAVWRVDFPWQSVTKKGQGKRMGGGKGPIDHYVTPIKSGRVIFEIGGHCEFKEVTPIFKHLLNRMPFPCVALDNEMLEAREHKKQHLIDTNTNPYTFKYLVQNNMGGVQYFISPYDRKWFGEHR